VLVTLAVLNALATPLEIDYHADLEGQMSIPRCGEAGEVVPDYAAQVAALLHLRDDAMYRGGELPVALLGGDELGPDLFVRGVLKRDGDAGARDISALLASAGYAAITQVNSGLNSIYNSLQTSFQRRFAHGLALQGSYTYAKVLGETLSSRNPIPQSPRNWFADYVPSCLNAASKSTKARP